MRILRSGLSEYVQFLMFLARESVDFVVVERLDKQVRAQLIGFDA